MAQIACELCGDKVHAIQIHIRDKHPTMTLADYQNKFPNAPLLSDEAQKKIDEKKAADNAVIQTNMAATSAVTSIAAPAKKAMHDLFGLGNSKAALSARGTPINVTVYPTPSDRELRDMIPQSDKNYIFPIDSLKSCLMGLELNIPTYLWGFAGVGKSTLPKQIAAKTNRPMIRVQHTINTEEAHILGQYVVENIVDPVSKELRTITRWQDGPLPFAMKHGLLYLMDEYDRCHPAALSVYQAVLEGEPLYIKEAPPELRLVCPHPHFRLIATGNTNGSGDDTGMFQATMQQDAATVERFGIVEKIEYMPEKQEIAVLVAQAGLSEEHAKKLRAYCEIIRRGHPSEFSLTIGPRVAINIGRLGIARGSFMAGVSLAFANRLPEAQRQAALSIAQREFGATI